MRMDVKSIIRISFALVITVFFSREAVPQAYEESRPCVCRGNPGLKKMISAGKIDSLSEQANNLTREKWSSSMLKPDGTPPKKLPMERDVLGESLAAYDNWSCRYSAYSIVDNDPATAWVEGAEGDGIGEVVVVHVKKNQPLAIWAGLGASGSLFKANNRPRKIRVYVFQAGRERGREAYQSGTTYIRLLLLGRHEVELKDVNGYQPLPLPKHTLRKDRGEAFIAIEILSVYPGSKYRDTCISEVRIDIDTKNASSKINRLIEKQKREVVFKTSWGAGPDRLGRRRENVYSYSVPQGFTLDDSGNIFILDQINKRIQVFDNDGRYLKAIPLPNSQFYDIDTGQSGNLFLLSKGLDPVTLKGTGSVILIDESGKELKRIGLIGKGIQNINAANSIYRSRDGLWTDIYSDLVRICDAFGNEEDDRLILKKAGKITSDEKYLFRVMEWQGKTITFGRRLRNESDIKKYSVDFMDPMFGAAVLDTDNNGSMYMVATRLVEENGPPYGVEDYHQILVVMDGDGGEKRRIYMPVSTWGLDNHRPYRVTRDGIIYRLVFDDTGAVMWRYKP